MRRRGMGTRLAMGLALLCALAGCGRTHGLLSAQDAGNAYMQDYFYTPGQALAQGRYFEVKALSHYVLHGAEGRTYAYRLVIAPRTRRPLRNVRAYFAPDADVQAYFAQCAHVDNFGMGADTWTTPYDAPTAFAPVAYTLMWSNGGDAFQQQHGMAHARMEAAMRRLHVTVGADGILPQTLVLQLPPAVHVDSADDPRIAHEKALQAVLRGQGRSCTRYLYRLPEAGGSQP